MLRHAAVELEPAEDYQVVRRQGRCRHVRRRAVLAGLAPLPGGARAARPPISHDRRRRWNVTVSTVVAIGNDRTSAACIAMADAVRPEAARRPWQALCASGVAHLVMLTGDNRATAEAIAREAGVDEVHAELLPEDKVAAVERLVTKYGKVAMVGDGVNDAPAMARASYRDRDGGAGSDAADRDGRRRADDRRSARNCRGWSATPAARFASSARTSCSRWGQGGVRRPDVRRVRDAVGGDRRRHRGLASRRHQCAQVAERSVNRAATRKNPCSAP